MSKVKRYFLILPILCIALIPCTSFFVSAYSRPFNFSISEPPVDNYHGYFVVPYYNSQLNIYQADLMYWVITPTVVDNNNTVPVATLDYNPLGNKFTLQFMTGQPDVAFTVAVYNTVGISPTSTSTQGNTYLKGIEVISYDDSPSFSFSYGSSISFYNPIFQGVTFVENESIPSSMGNASIVWADDAAHYLQLYESTEKLLQLVNGLDLTNEQLEETYALLSDYLSKIYSNTDTISSTLDRIWEDFYYWTWVVDADHARIIELLEALVNGTEDFTESSSLSPDQDELNRVEDELLNNEDASDAQNSINVDINENAMGYVWNLITQFLQSNPKVFGLVISVLSLGIIALILNR